MLHTVKHCASDNVFSPLFVFTLRHACTVIYIKIIFNCSPRRCATSTERLVSVFFFFSSTLISDSFTHWSLVSVFSSIISFVLQFHPLDLCLVKYRRITRPINYLCSGHRSLLQVMHLLTVSSWLCVSWCEKESLWLFKMWQQVKRNTRERKISWLTTTRVTLQQSVRTQSIWEMNVTWPLYARQRTTVKIIIWWDCQMTCRLIRL